MEAVRGGECYKFAPEYPVKAPAHIATIPFIRGVAGPTDYTPGGFSNSTYPHLTTYGFELALPIVIESGIIHYVDTPEKLNSLPDFAVDLLQELPAAWEDTKFLLGYPGQLAILARKSGNRWYIGGINGEGKTKKLRLDLESIMTENDQINLILDTEEGTNLKLENPSLEKPVVELELGPYGGFVGIISPK